MRQFCDEMRGSIPPVLPIHCCLKDTNGRNLCIAGAYAKVSAHGELDMDPVTIENRKRELKTLLDRVAARPSHDLHRERQRIIVLQAMLASARYEGVRPAGST